WKPDQQRVAATEHRDERLLHHWVLPEDHVADRRLRGGDLGAGRFRLANDHVFELFQPVGGCSHEISSFSSIHCSRRLWLRSCRQARRTRPKNVQHWGHTLSKQPRSGRRLESLATLGDYAIFHWVRSRLDAGLTRSPQNPDRSTEARERLNSLGFSGQPRVCPRGDRFARNHDPVETAVTTQVPGRQWQTKGAGALNSS